MPHYGTYLQELAAQLVAEEVVEGKRVLSVVVIGSCHCVPLDAIFIKQMYAAYYSAPRATAPGIKAIGVEARKEDGQDGVWVEAVLSAQEPTVNPELLAEALRQLRPELAPDFAGFTRIETYDADMRIYR